MDNEPRVHIVGFQIAQGSPVGSLHSVPCQKAWRATVPLHHSVITENHRDRILRLIKSLSPKVVTLLEQESNTNTSQFIPRFLEMLDYYMAMFTSIDAARPTDDKKRFSAEQHCVARDIVNMVACEDSDRVERHELLGKWRMRFAMAGFHQLQLSRSVGDAVISGGSIEPWSLVLREDDDCFCFSLLFQS
ncbi:hypothetical protein MLD38_037354 [Melastoma candidum]|uniref:Uncharacterized protein n=1 Tax=Melastoma candidum TaxID=119954 RepID=A0ACB9LN22_9MYRT|nr:hypothetical protein MLD38_037354 [Melastoma candidum]